MAQPWAESQSDAEEAKAQAMESALSSLESVIEAMESVSVPAINGAIFALRVEAKRHREKAKLLAA